MIRLIETTNGRDIYQVGAEFFVYGVTLSGDPRVCPSLGMAREVAASK